MDSATCVYFLELVLLDLLQTLDQQAGVRGNTGINQIIFNKVFMSSFFSWIMFCRKICEKKENHWKTILKILDLHCSKFQFTITNTEYLHSLKPIFYFYSFKYIEVTFLQITYRSKHLSYFLFNLGKLYTPSACQQNLDPKNTPSSFPSDTKIKSVLVQILNCVKHLHLSIEYMKWNNFFCYKNVCLTA